MDEITPTITADAGETMIVDPPAAERIKIESVSGIITPVDNSESISPDAEITNLSTDPVQVPSTIISGVIASDVVEGSVVVPVVETVVVIATPAVESITQAQIVASPNVTSISSTVSSVIASLSQSSALSAAASASRQTPHQELLQQNLSNAQDWDASDIEKKLSDNAAMLSQWTVLLDKNGTRWLTIIRYLSITYLLPLVIIYK